MFVSVVVFGVDAQMAVAVGQLQIAVEMLVYHVVRHKVVGVKSPFLIADDRVERHQAQSEQRVGGRSVETDFKTGLILDIGLVDQQGKIFVGKEP